MTDSLLQFMKKHVKIENDSRGERNATKNVKLVRQLLMRLCRPPNGSTSPKYKLLHFKPP